MADLNIDTTDITKGTSKLLSRSLLHLSLKKLKHKKTAKTYFNKTADQSIGIFIITY